MDSISALILSASSIVAPLSAAVVSADFNDNNTGTLGNFTAGADQGGGVQSYSSDSQGGITLLRRRR